jgi:hypothetical protein
MGERRTTASAPTGSVSPLTEHQMSQMTEALFADEDAREHVLKTLLFTEEAVRLARLGLRVDAGGRKWLAYPYLNGGYAKLRSIGGEKAFQRYPSGRPSTVYRAAVLDGATTAIVFEGERDAVAALSAQLSRDLLSLPDGARSGSSPSVLQELRKYSTVFLALDNDDAGNEAAIQMATDLGSERCRRVIFPGFKDFGDVLAALGREQAQLLALQSLQSARLMNETNEALIESSAERFLEGGPAVPRFVVEPYLPEREFVLLAGPPSAYKSFVGLDLVLCVAAGLPWGTAPTMRGRSAFITLEDDEAVVRGRVRAWVAAARDPLDRRRRADALKDVLVLTRTAARDLYLTETVAGGTVARECAVDLLVRLLTGRSIAFLETVARLHRGPETNDPFARFSDSVEEIVERTGTTIVLGHHVSQDAARNDRADMFSPRGGTSLPSAARGVLMAVRNDDASLSPVRLIHAKPPPNASRGPDLVFRPRLVPAEHALVMEPLPIEQAQRDDAEVLYQWIAASPIGRVERELIRSAPKGLSKASKRGQAALHWLLEKDTSVVCDPEGKRNGRNAIVYTVKPRVTESDSVSRQADAVGKT